ncbi:hypothetical protein KIW84_023219 [Lathyrus oleraceus]|uniref:Uncharacterized protein n=1 Tax=Pisum sativum TaxID=3888 RepID=A0A9D5BBL2_PEA|nr:hypothetical protein KIW84_023219 [Pisum sativum]
MYFGIGCSPTETVYAGSYHFVDFKMDLIKYISERPAVTGRVTKGPMILIEYDIQYTAQKASRGLVSWVSNLGTSTRATPFSLVYGMEAVLPVEVQIPSLRVLRDVKLHEAEWVMTRYEELSLIEEKRLATICHGQLYQQRMKRAFDRKVRPRVYHVGDMVLKRILPPQNDRRGKWTPNHEGSFVVKKVFSDRALLLTAMDDEDFPSPVNADAVVMWRLFDKTIPVESDQGRTNERAVKRRRWNEFALRRARSDFEYKMMEQKSPDESGSSQKWKADSGVRCRFKVCGFPSRVVGTNSPADSRSVDSLAGSGWLSPADLRSMLPQSPGLEIALSQRRSVRVSQAESGFISSASQRQLNPHRGLVVLIPSNIPKRIGCKGGFSPARVAFSQQQYYSPEGWRSEYWRVPQQSISSSPEESLEGDTFYAFIM